jgi:hypothetical protein
VLVPQFGKVQTIFLRYFEISKIEDVMFGVLLFMTERTNKEQYLVVL